MQSLRLTLSQDVVWESLGDEVVVVAPQQQRGWTLNAAAGQIWSLAGKGLALPAIAQHLARQCGAAVKDVEAEVLAFARRLAGEGLATLPQDVPETGLGDVLALGPGMQSFGLWSPQSRSIRPTGVTNPYE
jgi:hypothetical protein